MVEGDDSLLGWVVGEFGGEGANVVAGIVVGVVVGTGGTEVGVGPIVVVPSGFVVEGRVVDAFVTLVVDIKVVVVMLDGGRILVVGFSQCSCGLFPLL